MNNPLLLKFLQALGLVILMSVLTFLADSANLSGFVNPQMAGIVAGIAVLFEGFVKNNYGRAVFGLVRI